MRFQQRDLIGILFAIVAPMLAMWLVLSAFELWDFQEETIESFLNESYNIILKARQLGISTLCAAYAGWMATFFKNREIFGPSFF